MTINIQRDARTEQRLNQTAIRSIGVVNRLLLFIAHKTVYRSYRL